MHALESISKYWIIYAYFSHMHEYIKTRAEEENISNLIALSSTQLWYISPLGKWSSCVNTADRSITKWEQLKSVSRCIVSCLEITKFQLALLIGYSFIIIKAVLLGVMFLEFSFSLLLIFTKQIPDNWGSGSGNKWRCITFFHALIIVCHSQAVVHI